MCSQGAWRGMGPSTYARVAEIMSGRAISQQGLAATCKDLACKEESEARGGIWSGAWARTSDEGGVMLSEATREVAPLLGNTPRGQRSPGHSVAKQRRAREDMAGTARSNLPSGALTRWRMSRPGGKPTGRCTTHLRSSITRVGSSTGRRGGRQTIDVRGGCGPALEPPRRWAGPLSDKWRAEPRSEPDSGNPTVRDRRGALRTVALKAGATKPRAHATGQSPGRASALKLYPDNSSRRSTGSRPSAST